MAKLYNSKEGIFLKKNYNPDKKSTGDCVLRAFSAYLDKELSYDEIKEKIMAYGNQSDPTRYKNEFAFGNFAGEIGLVKVKCAKWNRFDLSNINRAINFSKQFKVGMLCIVNTHMAYIDPKWGLIDTWDSRGKRLEYFYIHRDDALMLGLEIIEGDFKSIKCDQTDDKIFYYLRGSKYVLGMEHKEYMRREEEKKEKETK